MRRTYSCLLILAISSLLTQSARAGCILLSPNLPPLHGWYESADDIHAKYQGVALTIILSNIKHAGFSNIANTPIAGGTHETFDSQATGLVSVNGSPNVPLTLTGPVAVDLYDNYTPGAVGTFNTEMKSLNLSAMTSLGLVMIRESTTEASTGQTTITDLGGGKYEIDSFFDIFTELSLDGGLNWIPADNSVHVSLTCPEPTTFAMLGLGGIVIALANYRRKNAG